MRAKLAMAMLLAVGSAFAAHGWQARPISTAAAPALPAVQALFAGYVTDRKMPGVVAAIGQGDAATSFPAAGAISFEPGAAKAGADTLWRVYSMTKPITGMAAMMLVEDGKLRLDQPVSDFFPAFRTMRVLTSPDISLDSIPARRQITVRMLLTHTAGLSYSISAKGPLLKEIERLGVVPATINAAVEAQVRGTRPTSLAAFAERAAQLPLVAEPGTTWRYSIGLDVMAAVIERASGMRFERFVQTRIFDPLKMRSSYWTVPASEVGRLADNYAFAGAKPMPVDPAKTSVWLRPPSFPYGGAGLIMSARDYDRFLHMLANGGSLDGVRVMKPETVRLGMSNLLPPGVTFTDPNAGGLAGPMGFGAGGSVYLRDVPGGASKGTYGWGGAAGTIAWVDPVRKVRGTVMVNYFPSDKWPLRADVVRALYAGERR